ncbi:Imm50 family immunity protein [Streptomyces sp. NPDC001941]|uniref:Imm50 family immunity protein n=1 Tax=Streptomyces sp. NPDC001941 TaxID=3154659 RepID=UPI0033342672
MAASDWTSKIFSENGLSELYGDPPALDECVLFYAQFDERGVSVTFGFDTRVLPDNPPADWADKPYNTVEFFLRFTGVRDLAVAGWNADVRDAHIAMVREEEAMHVIVQAPQTQLKFAASEVLVTRIRPYLAGAD